MTQNNPQQKLTRWLEDYALHCQMDIENAAGGEGSPPDFSGEMSAAEAQIRLWPSLGLQTEPMYGLLLSAGYARWRVIPFSPFLTPALPQELLIIEEGPARVLQGWNARELSGKQVAASWVVSHLAEEKLFLVHRWWLMLASGEVDVRGFGDLLGPPLRHPMDPRHDYLDSESDRADLCLAESSAHYEMGGPLDLAAEPEKGYGKNSKDDDGE